MSNVFEYIGDNNKLVIGDSYNSMSFSRSFLLSSTSLISSAGASYGSSSNLVNVYTFTLAGNEVFFAISATTPNTVGICTEINGSTAKILVNENGGIDTNSVRIYVFCTQKATDDRYGLELFRSDGTRIFHSSNYPLRVADNRDIYVSNSLVLSSGVDNISYGLGSTKYAISFSSTYSFPAPYSGYGQVYYMSKWNSGSALGFATYNNEMYNDTIPIMSSLGCCTNVRYVLIDVTNIPV